MLPREIKIRKSNKVTRTWYHRNTRLMKKDKIEKAEDEKKITVKNGKLKSTEMESIFNSTMQKIQSYGNFLLTQTYQQYNWVWDRGNVKQYFLIHQK